MCPLNRHTQHDFNYLELTGFRLELQLVTITAGQLTKTKILLIN